MIGKIKEERKFGLTSVPLHRRVFFVQDIEKKKRFVHFCRDSEMNYS